MSNQDTRPDDGFPDPAQATLAILTDPSQANSVGTLHGGVILRLLDECGAVAAARHAGEGPMVTAAVDSVTFLGPVRIGERLELVAVVSASGETSVESRIKVYAESKASGDRRKVAEGYALYVPLGPDGRPRPVASLQHRDPADRAAAHERRATRLARRTQAASDEDRR